MIGLQRWPKVEELREKINNRAKAEPKFRFYSLFDKVYRKDFLQAAYACCRANDGAPGVDGVTFERVESQGVERYLDELAVELKDLRYRPQPVLRVMIEKENQPGKFRPLGIPTIRDRIVQQAVKLLLEPIFEADFPENMHGYRAGRSAQDAINAVDECLRTRYVNVVDADLSKYFDTIPHDELLRSVERRVADHKVLWLIRRWLKVPVQETTAEGKTVISGGKSTKLGTPQGGVISPLLANIYFRRFLIGWERFGLHRKHWARIVAYADDFVILCQGSAQAAKADAQGLLDKLGLTLNTVKTQVLRAWQKSFNFLGYTFGKLHIQDGKETLGEWPSDRNVERHRETLRKLTDRRQTGKSVEAVVTAMKQVTQGFWQYFKLGAVNTQRHHLDKYTLGRMLIWAKRKYRPSRGTGKRPGQAARWAKIRAACRRVRLSKHVVESWREGGLFADAASYAK
jgi:RNA-directed DNA polymerase